MSSTGGDIAYELPPRRGRGVVASMGSRFGGLIVDFLIIAIPCSVISALVGGLHSRHTCTGGGHCTTSVQLVWPWYVDLLFLALGMAYWAYFVGVRTQSLGHRLAGVRVIHPHTGQPIGAGRAAVRWLVLWITGAIVTIGFWSPFFDGPRRRGWHDKLSKAVAVTSR